MGNRWDSLFNRLSNECRKQGIPICGQFELTPRCNLKCSMCYIRKPADDGYALKHERTANEWINLASEARDAGMLYLLLTGGEIFLRPDFKEIYEETSSMGFNIKLYTNGTMITPKIASWLGRIPPSKVEISLYGASPEIYEKICGDGGGFQRALKGIDLLLAEGINIELRTAVIRSNAGEFDRLMEIAEGRGIDLGIVDYITMSRKYCGTHPEKERLSPKEIVEYEAYVDDYYSRKYMNETASDSSEYEIEYDRGTENEYKWGPFQCNAGSSAFWVTWDGRMTPCGVMDKPETLPFETGFKNAWLKLRECCLSIPASKECMNCSCKNTCLTCPGNLLRETGAFDKAAPYLCSIEHEKIKSGLIKQTRKCDF